MVVQLHASAQQTTVILLLANVNVGLFVFISWESVRIWMFQEESLSSRCNQQETISNADASMSV